MDLHYETVHNYNTDEYIKDDEDSLDILKPIFKSLGEDYSSMFMNYANDLDASEIVLGWNKVTSDPVPERRLKTINSGEGNHWN